jgi:tryptophanyl-tRNA synthetase
MQEMPSREFWFFLADLHGLTVERSPKEVTESLLLSTAMYLACGLSPEKCSIFPQSAVKEHCELAWILNCYTPIGKLKRMTQFKDKAGKDSESINLALFSYPVLMSADILLYNADYVPVGEDQKQHPELARDIAESFNSRVGKRIFTLPEPIIEGHTTRVMSLRDGSKKMSKSDSSDFARINMHDSDDLIDQKIRKAKTDSIKEIYYDPEARPDVSNLIDIHCGIIKMDPEKFTYSSSLGFKQMLTESIISLIKPIRERYLDLLKDKHQLNLILRQGAETARQRAVKNMSRIKDSIGLSEFS